MTNWKIDFFKRTYINSFSLNQKRIIKKIVPQFFMSDSFCPENEETCVLSKLEIAYKNSGNSLNTGKYENVLLSNGLKLERYKFLNGLYAGIDKDIYAGTGYIDEFEKNIILLSSRGIIGYSPKGFLKEFKQIKNNINQFIGIREFSKGSQFSLKDFAIINKEIYVSYTQEIKTDCWNTSLLRGDFNYEEIEFKKFFSPITCIDANGGIDKEFNAHQSGGRISSFDDKNILLTIGDYRYRNLTQDDNSVNGKIIKINIHNPSNYKLFSKGHRNPQGLFVDKRNQIALETEHGPMGGDEINLIKLNNMLGKIPNYGWPIVSAGEHYGGKSEKNKTKYMKYPLYKSHKKFGFLEPLKSFVPSIGISQIVKIDKDKYVASSLKDHSIYFFNLDEENKINNLERIKVFERVRDIHFFDKRLFLFLEDTATLGVIKIH